MDCRRVIEVKDRDEAAALAGTLIHEVAHTQLHVEESDGPERAAREVEAEAVTYVVGHHVGLDVSGSSFYLAAWADDPVEDLQKRLERISMTARTIIEAVAPGEQEVQDGS